MPCRVERYLVVKSSTGVIKVVALGPKLAKKKVSAYITMNSQMDTALICLIAAARMIRMVVIMVKPAWHPYRQPLHQFIPDLVGDDLMHGKHATVMPT